MPPAKPPVPNRLNDVLPGWLRVRGEFRERVEGFDNSGFNASRDDMYYLSRFRFNATTTSKYIGTTVQVQDARVGKKTVGSTAAPFKAPFDLRMAFADVGTAKSKVMARVGRQELTFGDQRLVGHAGWLNAARTFDAAKVTFKSPAVQLDVFGASVVRIMDGEFDKSGAGNRFAGAYATTARIVPKGSVEPYLFYRRDGNLRGETGVLGSLRQVTTGARVAGRMPARHL